MRVGFNGRMPLPATVRARRRTWSDGAVTYRGSIEALRVLGCAVTGLCGATLVGPLPGAPEPPMWLERAGVYAETAQYDHDSLYARVAVDLLRGEVPGVYPADWDAARAVARRVAELLNWKYAPERDRYIVVSEPSAYARFRVAGRGRMSDRACREWYGWAHGEPPLRREEVPEVLRDAPCRAYAVRVKDAAKFSILAAIGYTKRTTGLWRYVVAWAGTVVRESAEWLREQGVPVLRGYVDSYQVEGGLGREPPLWKRYPVKLEGRGPGIVVLPPTYRAGDSYGLWGVWLADGEPPEVPVASGRGGTVWYVPGDEWYRLAVAVLRCEADPPPAVRRVVGEAARRFGVDAELCRGGCRVVDRRAGVVRLWVSRERVVRVLGLGVVRR